MCEQLKEKPVLRETRRGSYISIYQFSIRPWFRIRPQYHWFVLKGE